MSTNDQSHQTEKQNSSLDSYIKDISKFKLLTRENEAQIVKDILNGNSKSREQLVQGCLRVVITIASRYSHLNVPIEDLINDGNIGLINASESFDPTKGFRFITFAYPHITGAVLSSIHINSSLIRIPKYITQKKNRIEKQLHRNSNSEIKLKIDHDLLREYNELVKWNTISPKYVDFYSSTLLLKENNEEHISLSDPETKASELKTMINSALSILSKKEQNVILLYFSLKENSKDKTFQSISNQMGLSKEGVRVMKVRALKKLKTFLGNIDLEEYLDI